MVVKKLRCQAKLKIPVKLLESQTSDSEIRERSRLRESTWEFMVYSKIFGAG